jgi:two-component system, NarL family, sensor histidine kinase UhpB
MVLRRFLVVLGIAAALAIAGGTALALWVTVRMGTGNLAPWLVGASGSLSTALVLALCIIVHRRLRYDAGAAQDRLREGEARLDAIVRSAMDAIITVDAEQRIVLFNNAAERMFGVDAGQAIGAPLERFIPERFRAAHRDHIAQFGHTGETSRRMGRQQALWARRADGTEFPIEASISHTIAGGQQLFSVILRDITRRLAADAEIERSHAQLRDLAATMHGVREAEQTRIARELHDELGQALTALKMDVDLLEHLSPPGRADLLERTAAMRGLLDFTVQTTRRISADLRPLVLDDLGLSAAAEWLVQQLRQRARLDCKLAIDPSLGDLEEPYASVIFRVMQESLTNVAKHARASRVELRLEREGDWAVLTVRDDGVGMGPHDESKPRSFGLRGIRERVLVVGGEVRIVSPPGRGTTLVVRVPLRAGAAREAA